MARTRASVGRRLTGGKNTKKVAVRATQAPVVKARLPSTSRSRTGGNSYCPRSTPKWQRPITNFFKNEGKTSSDGGDTSCDTDDEKENTKENEEKSEIVEEEKTNVKNKGNGKKTKPKSDFIVNEINEKESNSINIINDEDNNTL